MTNFNGDKIPNLAGCVCTGFLAESGAFRGRRQGISAYYLQVGDNRWHRFRVNCMGVSWNVYDSPYRPALGDWQFETTPFEDADLVIGRRVHRVTYAERWAREDTPPPPMTFRKRLVSR